MIAFDVTVRRTQHKLSALENPGQEHIAERISIFDLSGTVREAETRHGRYSFCPQSSSFFLELFEMNNFEEKNMFVTEDNWEN